jgi:glycosyltransferase involved in cell wall biosynthesis
VGAKRNLACNAAQGEIIVHWDDDDWMADWRISYQVAHLLREQTDLCGLDRLLLYNPDVDQAWEYIYPQASKPWAAGGTLCYRKDFWKINPFLKLNVGEDTRFVWSKRPKRMTLLQDNTFYVALIHPGNISPKRPTDNRWHAHSTEHIRTLLGQDISFYAGYAGHSPHQAKHQNSPEYTSQSQANIADSHPLVSCIMPTYNRPLFVPQAIQYFLRQDYPHKELVIVDDGSNAVADLIPLHAQIRYVRLNQKVSVGAKRNTAVEQSHGKIIVHWDDDDWYAANRISYQVEPLLEQKAEVCGLETGYIYDLLEDTFWSCDADLHAMMFYADIHGGSIVYTREVWEKYAKYPDLSLAEDATFLRAAAKKVRITKLLNRNVFIYLRHNSNAWEFICGHFINPSAWKRIPAPAFLRQDDVQFYHQMLAKLLLDTNTHKAKGDSLRQVRRYEDALQCYERAIELDPTNVWAWYGKGRTLEKLGHYDKALQAIHEADQLLSPQDGNRTWIHSALGTLFRLLGDIQQAKYQWETALRYNAKNPIARDGLRRRYLRQP